MLVSSYLPGDRSNWSVGLGRCGRGSRSYGPSTRNRWYGKAGRGADSGIIFAIRDFGLGSFSVKSIIPSVPHI
jgi:hypothetical protein